MKILQINNVYKKGSTGKIVFDIHTFLCGEGIDSIVCYGRGQHTNEKNIYKTSLEVVSKINALRARITGLQYNGSVYATNKLINIIKREQPDIVHLQCINGYFTNIYKLMDFLKKSKIKTVITLHAEFMYTGSCDHAFDCEQWKIGCSHCPQLWTATKSIFFDRTHTAWNKMKNSFDGFENLKIIAVSKWVESRAKQSCILNQHSISVIHNGIDTKTTFRPTTSLDLRTKYKLGADKIILHVTANFSLSEDDIKGGHFVVQIADKLKDLNVVIIIVGSKNTLVIIPNNILYIGKLIDQHELAEFYSLADLTLITSKRETFSMVCVESLSCGTPVVGFKAGGPESIAIEEYSEFVDYGNIDMLEFVIRKWLNVKSISNSDSIYKIAEQMYSRKKMGLEYLRIYKDLSQTD